MELEQCTNVVEYQKRAREIAREFLGLEGTEQRLTIPSNYKCAIENALKKKKFNNKVFIEARMDIESVLRTKYVAFCSA